MKDLVPLTIEDHTSQDSKKLMHEIETALLYFQDGTKQFTDQRETSLCVTFVGMFLLREALYKFLLYEVTDQRDQNEIKDILFFRPGKLSLPKWPLEGPCLRNNVVRSF